MFLENINFPVAIISSPRVGSHPLSYFIKEKYSNVKIFSEPDLFLDTESNFKTYYNLSMKKNTFSKNIILKIMAAKVISHYNFINWKKFTVIRLSRKDVVSQCVSHYIAHMRSTFLYFSNIDHKNIILKNDIIPLLHTFDVNSVDKQDLPINNTVLQWSIENILKHNQVNASLLLDIDFDLCYEEIIQYISDQKEMVKTPKPKNYEEIYQLVAEKIKNYQKDL